MESFLRKQITVRFASLFLDRNNPRLAQDKPGYDDVAKLFDTKAQKPLAALIRDGHDGKDLPTTIAAQGWMPLDGIITWQHPDDKKRYVVLEGNRRVVALRDLRERLPREIAKLESMRKKNKQYKKRDVDEQEQLVQRISRVVDDTEEIAVFPLDAASIEELLAKLPRVLAVRHIQGARSWGNYAEDLWLLDRYSGGR